MITVDESAHALLADWEAFFVIVGGASAVLIGLQFVVGTLIADSNRRAEYETISAFGTPTVVHLSGALLVSAIMSAPWTSLWSVSTALVLAGLGGLAYSAIVLYRARHQTAYEPEWEDWVWYLLVPCAVYAALALAAVFLHVTKQVPLFVIAATALGLLFIAIHNAWDTVMYIAVTSSDGDSQVTSDDPDRAPLDSRISH